MHDSALKQSTDRGNKSNKRALRAMVIPLRKKEEEAKELEMDGKTKTVSDDPFESLVREGRVLEPPFDLMTLAMLPEQNSELSPCISAMASNIDGYGYRFVPRIQMDSPDLPDELKSKIETEMTYLQNFFTYVAMKDSFTGFRKKLRSDLETTGNAWFEVVRSVSGKIQGFNHIPSYQMRLGPVDREPLQVDMKILELQNDGSVEIRTVKVWTRFRMHAQSKTTYFKNISVSSNYALRWFKEFGDPRTYDNTTGYVVPAEKLVGFPEDMKANEVFHMTLYCPRSPYGMPRFIGNLLSIFGDRAAEEINYITFRNNNVPSMALLVSNGQLTEGTIKRIESFVESHIQGSDNYSKFLIIEAESMEMLTTAEDSGTVKLDIKPLTKEQVQDELFQVYQKNNQAKIRRSFRIPSILLGATEDLNRATADTARKLADEQVFAPEREEFDSIMNRIFFPEMGILYHKFRSNSPNTTDNAQIVQILSGAEKTGGMTPRIARRMLEEILGNELPQFPKDFPADLPFSMLMAEAVKNQADVTEPGQQVTAIKSLKEEDFLNLAVRVRERLEKEWQAATESDHDHGAE